MPTSTVTSGDRVMPSDDGDRRGPRGDRWHGGHEFVTAHQAAEYLGVHYRTIHRWASAGHLTPFYLAGLRSVRFARAEVENLLREAEEDQNEGGCDL